MLSTAPPLLCLGYRSVRPVLHPLAYEGPSKAIESRFDRIDEVIASTIIWIARAIALSGVWIGGRIVSICM